MNEHYVLVDLENVQPAFDDLARLAPGFTDVWLFHGRNQTRLAEKFRAAHQGVTPVPISRTGKNALDFHLSFYLGYLAAKHPSAPLVIVANDRGYNPMIGHANSLGFAAHRVGFKAKKTTSAARPAQANGRAPAAAKPSAATTAAPAQRQAAAKKSAPGKQAVPPKEVGGTKRAESTEKPAPAKKAPSAQKTTPISRPVPAKQAASNKQPAPAKKTVSAKQTASARHAASATQAMSARGTAPTKRPVPEPKTIPAKKAPACVPAQPATAPESEPSTVSRVAKGLSRMGNRHPEKLQSLLRHLESILGRETSQVGVQALVRQLEQTGAIRISGGRVNYAS